MIKLLDLGLLLALLFSMWATLAAGKASFSEAQRVFRPSNSPSDSASFGRLVTLAELDRNVQGDWLTLLASNQKLFAGEKEEGEGEEGFQLEESRQKRSSGALGRERRGLYQGTTFKFYETAFSSTIRSFTWNQDDPTRMLVLAGFVPFLSVDSGKNFLDLSSSLEGFDTNHTAMYGGNSGGIGVRSVFRSPADHDYYLLFGRGTNLWQTKNAGTTFVPVDIKSGGSPLYPRYITLHPTRRDVLVASHVDAHCLDGSISSSDPVCSYEVYISKDFGKTWTQIATHVWSFFWGTFVSHSMVSKDSVYLLVSSDTGSHQSNSPNTKTAIVEVVIDDLSKDTILTDVSQMLSIGEYVYAIAKVPGSSSSSREVLVSHLGGPFKETSFYAGELRGLYFMEYSEGSVLLIDTPNRVSASYADFRGDVWSSESTGTFFTRALPRVILQQESGSFAADFHKIESMEGTYIATVQDSGDSLRTKISWNRGGTWHDVKSQAGIDGLINEAQTPFILYGDFHSNSQESHLGVYSEQSAPGVVLAIGSHGAKFVDYIRGDVTSGDVYYSRNGGKSFSKILAGVHFCRVVDEGGVIVCLPGSPGGTNIFKYSIDSGLTWQQDTFSDHPVTVLTVTSDPRGFGLVALIIALDADSNILFISVDVGDLNLRPCVESDYEEWMPSDGQDEKQCVLGHHNIYNRLKANADCFSSMDQFLVSSIPCACGPGDFECAAGYYFDPAKASCTPEPGTPVTPINCVDGNYTKYLNYRKIPGDNCDPSLPGSVDLEAGILAPCPVDHLIEDNEYKKKLALGLGLGLTFLGIIVLGVTTFVVYSAKKGHLQYRRVLTQENNAVELDAPDHPDDFDEDNQSHNGGEQTQTV